MTVLLSEPGPIEKLNVSESFLTNLTSISWTGPLLGGVDFYLVSYKFSNGSIFHNISTNGSQIELVLLNGYQFVIEVVVAYENLQSEPRNETTLIGELTLKHFF